MPIAASIGTGANRVAKRVVGLLPLVRMSGAIVVTILAIALTAVPELSAQATEAEETQVVYPNSDGAEAGQESNAELYKDLMPEGGSGIGMAVTILGYLVILGGMAVAAWYLFKRGVIKKPFSSSEGKLKVAESRMLGNRLLDGGPRKVDYLTSLDGYGDGFPKIEPELGRVSVQELA